MRALLSLTNACARTRTQDNRQIRTHGIVESGLTFRLVHSVANCWANICPPPPRARTRRTHAHSFGLLSGTPRAGVPLSRRKTVDQNPACARTWHCASAPYCTRTWCVGADRLFRRCDPSRVPLRTHRTVPLPHILPPFPPLNAPGVCGPCRRSPSLFRFEESYL